ncbi:hypothetical protein LZ30DRAFT_73054 [Colletotrichum cereale]|nr:hypothetical protein LZ30DRAFT_73054 [Colletotrichum cereale]
MAPALRMTRSIKEKLPIFLADFLPSILYAVEPVDFNGVIFPPLRPRDHGAKLRGSRWRIKNEKGGRAETLTTKADYCNLRHLGLLFPCLYHQTSASS